ncbi:hypothetical protein ACVOMV_25095 [Mesorhizobium atlanticum]
MRTLCAFAIIVMAFQPAFAADTGRVEAKTARGPTLSSGCVDFTNLGTANPKLLNSCNDEKTVQVVNYDKNGNLVATRVFHLWDKETRPLAFPGYQMAIEWEKGWTSDGADDGARFLTLYNHDIDGEDVWEVRNSSSDRYNAFRYKVYENARLFGSTWYVLMPGQSAKIYGFIPPDKGYLILDWSRLDPQ